MARNKISEKKALEIIENFLDWTTLQSGVNPRKPEEVFARYIVGFLPSKYKKGSAHISIIIYINLKSGLARWSMGLAVFRKSSVDVDEVYYDSPYMPIEACIEDVEAFNAINSQFSRLQPL